MAEKKEEIVRCRNRTDVAQIVYVEGRKRTVQATPVKGTIMLPLSLARKYRQAFEVVSTEG